MSAEQLSRRKTVAALAATVACTLTACSSASAESDLPDRTQGCTGPSFSATGSNAGLRVSDAYLLPGRATKKFGYGYLLWLFPGERRQFALLGYKGQYVCVDPASKLVMVHTAVEEAGYSDEPWALWSAVVDQLG